MEWFKDDFYGTLDKEYHIMHSMLGAPTSPQTANQIAEATARLNAGVKNIELQPISPEIFEAIPKQHFKEIKRLADVTGSEVSLHAPVFEPAGFSREGWSETERKKSEYQLFDAIEKAHDLNPKGNPIVNIHSSGGVPAYEWQKEKYEGEEKIPEGEKRMMVVVNRETGQMAPLKYEEKEFVGGKEYYHPETRLKLLNDTQWDEENLRLFNLQHQKFEIEDRFNRLMADVSPLLEGERKGVLTSEEEKILQDRKQNIGLLQQHKTEIDRHLLLGLNEMYHKLQYVPKEYKGDVEKVKKNLSEGYLKDQKRLEELNELIQKTKDENEQKRLISELLDIRRDQINTLHTNLSRIPSPEIFVPTDEFAKEKTAKTVSNAAFEAYKRFGDKTPTIAIENVMPDWTLGRAESLKEAVIKTREEFAKRLVKEKHLSENEAKNTAEKLIGATWDVGHINLLRKFGYSGEDILEETKKIAKFVKHTHLTDNFGFNDSHLPPGMGNIPIKGILEELEKAGFKGKGIVEAGAFVQHFKTSPHPYTLRYLSSPLYTEKAEPYWSQVSEMYGAYNTGFGTMLPEKHFEIYGSGFSNLPQELGGQIPGDKSRFSGTPID